MRGLYALAEQNQSATGGGFIRPKFVRSVENAREGGLTGFDSMRS